MYRNLIKPVKKSQGFTIVELLIFMVLMSILLTVVTNLFMSVVHLRLETEAASSVEEDSKYIFSRLQYDIQRATSVTTPASAGDTSSSLGITIEGETFTYALSEGNLQLTTSSTTDNLNGFNTSLSSITFERLENDRGDITIKILYTVNSKTLRNGQAETKTVETTVGLR